MKPTDFIVTYYPHALAAEKKSGISRVFILAQAAIESGGGKSAPGNMFFGVKDSDGINGNEQLLRTTEYHSSPNVKYPKIISITQVGVKLWKYRVYDYFRKYETASDSFTDHCNFFVKNKRYKEALKVKSDPNKFAEAIAAAGYATDPLYVKTLKSVIKTVQTTTNLI